MPDRTLPDFLEGVFDWRLNDLHLEQPAPVDLLAPDALVSENVWIVLAAILERAKVGDHSQVPLARRFFHDHTPPALSRSALLLIGDCGRERDLPLLVDAMGTDDAATRRDACVAAAFAGRLSFVPHMLQAWLDAETLHDHEIIGFAIADLVEQEGGGEIAAAASIYQPKLPHESSIVDARSAILAEKRRQLAIAPVEFPALVETRYRQLVNQYGSERVNLWNGEIVDVRSFVHRFLGLIRDNAPVSLFKYRHKLEATTGLDCSDFFFAGQPQYLEIAVTLERFLESPDTATFEPGVRYFFRHVVPD